MAGQAAGSGPPRAATLALVMPSAHG